jgi:hypothetical protein
MSGLATRLSTFELHLHDTLRASEGVGALKSLGLGYAASNLLPSCSGRLPENVLTNLRLLQQQRTRVAELLEQIAGV